MAEDLFPRCVPFKYGDAAPGAEEFVDEKQGLRWMFWFFLRHS
jgi:hypothetical protein